MKLKRTLGIILASVILTASLPVSAGEVLPPSDGEGTVIAVLDRGFDLSHESFTLTYESVSLTKERSDALLALTSAVKGADVPETLYVSPKIPFAYDYGDMDADVSQEIYAATGTNLLSIAAGNGKNLDSSISGATGIAPESQVLAMKVHSDKTGDVTAEAMVHAINDSVTLGADVILIGIVSMNGLDNREATESVNAAIENAEAHGVIVVCSAGSVMEYGSGSVYEKVYDYNMINADSPDVGTIAWPGNLRTTLTVTSADPNTVISDFFTLVDGTRVPYGDSNYMFTTTGGVSFDKFFDGKTLEYVLVGGKGSVDDFAEAGDLTGKLALVERGEITFAQKAANAAAQGALGLIVIDNQADKTAAVSLLMDLTGATVPAVIISGENGVLLKSATDKRITIKDGESYITYTRKTPSISDGNACGSTPDLLLKPDIAAVGTNVQCATVKNGYTYISSSRAAAANVAGACAVIKAHLAAEHPSLGAAELMSLTRAVLVSSAQNMEYLTGKLYSPRIQGGGALDIDAAMDADLILLSGGSHKIELGEYNSPLLKLSVTARNLSGKARACTLDAIVGADSFEQIVLEPADAEQDTPPYYESLGYKSGDTASFIERFTELEAPRVTLADGMYNLNRAAGDYSPYTFTLAPGASETFEVTLYLDEATYARYREVFDNGFFVEGYMRLSSDGDTATIPYLGYIGDYSASPALDASIYSGEQHIYDPIYLYRYLSAAGGGKVKSILGSSSDMINEKYDENAIVFSPVYDCKNAGVYLNLGLRRSIVDASVCVCASDGEIIVRRELGELMRTYMSASTGKLTSPQIYVWDGRATDNPAYIYPDGEYTVRLTYRAPGCENVRELSYILRLDSSAPTLDEHKFSSVDGYTALSVAVSDNFGASRVSVVDGKGTFAAKLTDGLWDVSALTGKYVYVEIYDLAMNSTVVRLENPYFESDS